MPHYDNLQILFQAIDILGEGALWSQRHSCLFWVDIIGQCLHRFNFSSKQSDQWFFKEPISAVSECKIEPRLLLALKSGLAFWNPNTPDVDPVYFSRPEADIALNRMNDGKCDLLGNFWLGSMDSECKRNTGALYKIDSRGVATMQESNICVSNGPTWTLDYKTMLFNDTMNYIVFAYDFNEINGTISHKKVWHKFNTSDGFPDGMCTDSNGRVWICHYGGSCITCHEPFYGTEIGRIHFPASQITSCCFGGENMTTLFVTSSRHGLNSDQLKLEPLAGSLFSINMSCSGIRPNLFSL